jgi:hypothetical protein
MFFPGGFFGCFAVFLLYCGFDYHGFSAADGIFLVVFLVFMFLIFAVLSYFHSRLTLLGDV